MSFKQRLGRFRKWQQEPFSYSRDTSTHKCNNCGEQFQGNYCPTCSQGAHMGRITWESVGRGFLELWGLHTRSMPYSLWQLLLRPGYFIGDYISGRRQVSFPPVKMLVIMGLVILLISNWLNPSVDSGPAVSVTSGAADSEHVMTIFNNVLDWFGDHYDWFILVLLSFLIWPTWVLFRVSPRCDHHTLPEGFFIQVFNSVHILLLLLIKAILVFLLPWLGHEWGAIFYLGIIIIQLYRSYKQLFNHSHWGTIWRMVVAVVLALMLLMAFTISFVSALFAFANVNSHEMWDYIACGVLFPIPVVLAIFIVVGISCACIKYQLKKDAAIEQQEELKDVAEDVAEDENIDHPS